MSAPSLPLALGRVSKRYGDVLAVDDVSLTIEPGRFVTLLGPSGSGKTTLLMMIAGFTQPSAGTIRLGARDITALPPERRDFGMVFQGYALFPHLSVRDNIAFPLKLRKMSPDEVRRGVDRMLEMMELGGRGDRFPRQLSGGQPKAIAIVGLGLVRPFLREARKGGEFVASVARSISMSGHSVMVAMRATIGRRREGCVGRSYLEPYLWPRRPRRPCRAPTLRSWTDLDGPRSAAISVQENCCGRGNRRRTG